MKECMDYVMLRHDIKEDTPTDLFSKQIIEKYPEMVKQFLEKFYDLNENAVWIKKPTSITPTKLKNKASIKKERSKPNKIPAKPLKKPNELTKTNSINKTSKQKSKINSKPMVNENKTNNNELESSPIKTDIAKQNKRKIVNQRTKIETKDKVKKRYD